MLPDASSRARGTRGDYSTGEMRGRDADVYDPDLTRSAVELIPEGSRGTRLNPDKRLAGRTARSLP